MEQGALKYEAKGFDTAQPAGLWEQSTLSSPCLSLDTVQEDASIVKETQPSASRSLSLNPMKVGKTDFWIGAPPPCAAANKATEQSLGLCGHPDGPERAPPPSLHP